MKENVDYELVAGDNDYWDIRILSGYFTETVFHFNNVYLDEQDDVLRYNATIVFTPDKELSESDSDFQKVIGEILISIFDNENS